MNSSRLTLTFAILVWSSFSIHADPLTELDENNPVLFITPEAVVSSTAGGASPDLFAAAHLIDGSGLSATPTQQNIGSVTHATSSVDNAWVTGQLGAANTDYFAEPDPDPVLTFTLASPTVLNGFVFWGYSIAGNEAKTFSLALRSSSNVLLQTLVFDSAGPINSDNCIFQFPAEAGVKTVEVTVTDNHYPLAGGDRAGLGEVRFLAPAVLYVDASVTAGMTDGTSWADAFSTLQDALVSAAAGTEIRVAQGTYYPDEGSGQTDNDRLARFTLKSDVQILGGYPSGGGTPAERDPAIFFTTLSGDLAQNDGSANGNSENAYHVLSASNVNSGSLLDGFQITGGNANVGASGHVGPGDVVADSKGGGLRISGGDPTFTNCHFTKNAAKAFGGGVSIRGSAALFTHCLFSENTGGIGGAVENDVGANVSFVSCSFVENSGSSGGAVQNYFCSPIFTNCAFLNNSGTFGGAAYNDNNSGGPSFLNCSLQGNSAASSGGTLYNRSGSTVSVTNSILWENSQNGSSSTPGASVANVEGSTVIYSHSLAQNLNLSSTGTNNFDGTNPASDPRFTSATSTRLPANSPYIDAGDSAVNLSAIDVFGNPRKVGVIDLGAWEHQGFVYVDAGVGSGGSQDGSTWPNAFPTLQDALVAVTPGKAILVAEGNHYPDEGSGQISDDRNSTFTLLSNIDLFGGFPQGGGTFNDRDLVNHPTILSGDLMQNDDPQFVNIAENCYQVLTASSVDGSLLDGFTITGGNGYESGGGILQPHTFAGAGLWCPSNAFLSVSNCIFTHNSSISLDGGVTADGQGGALAGLRGDLANCHFENNRASKGGALVYNGGRPKVSNCSFLNNSAASAGGAIYNLQADVQLTNCIFHSNTAAKGGAYSILFATTTASNCTFFNNSASTAGGAIFTDNPVTNDFTLLNCIAWDNSENGSRSVPGASIFNSVESPIYLHCLLQNLDLSSVGTGNLDGTLPSNNPRFVSTSDLRFLFGSPALDAGQNPTNATAFDLAGNARIQGSSIDLGAYEGHFGDANLLFATDFDFDGIGYGVETALGTDPFLSDLGNARNLQAPTFDSGGNATLVFGRNSDAILGTQWVLTRSTTLAPGSFETIYQFDGSSTVFNESGNFPIVNPQQFQITDSNPPVGSAFYRFEARFVEPE